MSLKWLEARKFRNLSHISVDLDPGLNLFFGGNGSGNGNGIGNDLIFHRLKFHADTQVLEIFHFEYF